MLDELKRFGFITSPWALVQSVRNFALTVWDPTRSDIRQGVNALLYGALKNPSPERIRRIGDQDPKLLELFESAYDPGIDVDRLAALPENTLGGAYARFIRQNGIDPLGDLFQLPAPTNVLEYTFRRAYKLHDLMHVVLGCDASVLGEVRIVSYSVGQRRGDDGAAADLALAVLFLHLALRKPGQFKEAIRLSAEWMRIGEQSKLYVTCPLEDLLERRVHEVREMVLAA